MLYFLYASNKRTCFCITKICLCLMAFDYLNPPNSQHHFQYTIKSKTWSLVRMMFTAVMGLSVDAGVCLQNEGGEEHEA